MTLVQDLRDELSRRDAQESALTGRVLSAEAECSAISQAAGAQEGALRQELIASSEALEQVSFRLSASESHSASLHVDLTNALSKVALSATDLSVAEVRAAAAGDEIDKLKIEVCHKEKLRVDAETKLANLASGASPGGA